MTHEPEPRPALPAALSSSESAELRGGKGDKPAARAPRWWRRLILLGAGAGCVVALALWFWWPSSIPDPLLPDLTGADQEVVEAIEEARAQVLTKRSSPAAWGQLGEVLLAHEYNPEANRCFRQAETLDPLDPAWPYLQGLNLVIHDPEAGIPYLKRAAERCDKGQVGPQLFLAEVLLERGRLDEAQGLLELVRRDQPHDNRATLGIGRLAVLRQDWKGSLAALETCRADDHTRKRAAILRAEAWGQLGEAERARVERRLAESLPPDRAWHDPLYEKVMKRRKGLRARFQSVQFLMQSGRSSEALDLLQETTAKYPHALEAWMRLGEIWFRVKRLDKAQECFRKAVGLSPELAEAWFRLGCAQALTHSREAVTSFRKAIRLKGNFAQAHYNLGQCLKEHGNRDGAVVAFQEALRCRPDYELARTALRELQAPPEKDRKQE